MDGLDLQRLLTALVMPLPLGLGLAVLGLLLRGAGVARRAATLALLAGLGAIWIAATPQVAYRLMAGLEAAYPPAAAADCGKADAIVVLGGAVRPLTDGDFAPRLHRGSDRVWQAARLYRAGCAPRVVVSAGGLVKPPLRAPETEAIATLLVDLGVPRSALLLEADSRTTQDNAAFSRALLAPLGIDRVLLVTSAWHLRRAVPSFERAGFAVIPAGADYRALDPPAGIERWLPDPGALDATHLAVKEYLGYIRYFGRL